MLVAFCLFVALASVTAWFVVRALVTGRVVVNDHLLNRSRNPIGYWIGMVVCSVILCAWCVPLVRLWKAL
jgi:hypothetical protein